MFNGEIYRAKRDLNVIEKIYHFPISFIIDYWKGQVGKGMTSLLQKREGLTQAEDNELKRHNVRIVKLI